MTDNQEVDSSRRNFLKLLGIGAGTAAGILAGIDRYLPEKYSLTPEKEFSGDGNGDGKQDNFEQSETKELESRLSLEIREDDPENENLEQGDMWFRKDL